MKQKHIRGLSPLLLFLVISTQINAQCLCTYFSSFTAAKSGCTVNLAWSTAQEPCGGTDKFLVFRSSDAAHWIQIASVTGNSCSVINRNYTYSDVSPYNPSGTVYYFLELLNGDGAVADQTPVRNFAMGSCSGSLGSLCGTPSITGYTVPFYVNTSEVLAYFQFCASNHHLDKFCSRHCNSCGPGIY